MTQTLKKYRLSFTYETVGQVIGSFNPEYYPDEESIIRRMLDCAAEDYRISTMDISGYTLKEIES